MTPEASSRRSCDLCYTKKIKCNAQKPRCSNCEQYTSDCTYAATSRRTLSRKQRQRAAVAPLESRVEYLETRLADVLEKIDRLEERPVPKNTARSPSLSVIGSDINDPGLPAGKPHGPSMELPPLQEVLAAVEKYLTTSNAFLPLFHPGRLLRSVHRWYSHPEQRVSATWAAINVVLALAYCQADSDEENYAKKPVKYLNNAQSVLTEITMRDVDLTNVQVLAGLAMLFQGALDLKPATILIATALRLAHGLGLHTRSSSANLDNSLALERDRVFWIIYILDRDISFRTRQPPLQLETEIDLDLPPEESSGDNAEFMATGNSQFNFLRARIQLAHIQGRVYNCLYSVQAQNVSPEQRNKELAGVRHLLNDWTSHLPSQVKMSALSQGGTPTLSRYFGVLYATRQACLSLASQAHPWDRRWLENLQAYSGGSVAEETDTPVSLTHNWQGLVHECREFMAFFVSIHRKDASFIWMTACTYIACLVCVVANSVVYPLHDFLQLDMHLSVTALLFLEDIVLQTTDDSLQKLRDACKELMLKASFISQEGSAENK
ncbi:fungal-specific transcription factor domain-containing protein [Ilyonectria robusta]|uniref:fungal-specific transcription factor domain-containing protein n=1 Tax=Ilyonectria robusta TaxID=1079257 RepID=UPI001E8D82E7|nr:fungal-specific transcription factor domain-containing protein [Ilyonectria robusta]KAH8688520.1 fungal-specific transcription factor domain-containing protein [Ilyonectria robusta]